MCSCVIKYVGVGSLGLDNGLRYVDVFIRVAFFDVQGQMWGFYRGSNEYMIFGLKEIDT
jgi:hypothetical protein